MEIEVTHDVERFAAQAETFLASRLECNIIATIAQATRTSGPVPGWGDPWFALGIDSDSRQVVGAALRTPPRHLIACGFNTVEAAEQLMNTWLEVDPDLNGISAMPEEAALLVGAWQRITGGRAELQFSEALHELEAVTPPPDPPPGELRRSEFADLGLVSDWLGQFTVETRFGDPSASTELARRAITNGRSYLWDDGGPVALVGHAPRIAGVNRVGPVYTPPELRGRGYASAAVAALSQLLLDDGARRCMLFTDLANPTSNKIYAAIGYRRFGAWEEHRFLTEAGVQ